MSDQISGPDAIKQLGKLNADQAAKWIQEHIDQLTPETVTQITNWSISSGFDPNDQQRKAAVASAVQQTAGYVDLNKNPVAMDRKATEVVGKAVQGQPVSGDLDGDGKVSDRERQAITKAKGTVAVETNTPIQQVDKAAAVSGIPALSSTPRWILDAFQGLPGSTGDLSQTQKNRVVDEWNAVYGTHFDWNTLIQQAGFNDPTSTTTGIVQAAVNGDEPTVAYTVKLPGNRSVTIDENTHKLQVQANGITTPQMVKAIQYADAFGMANPTGGVDWQPVAALMKATGQLPTPKDPEYERLKAQVAKYSDPAYSQPKAGESKAGAAARGQLPSKGLLAGAQKALADYEAKHPEIARQQSKDRVAGVLGINLTLPGLGVSKITQAFQRGMKQYGEPTMAYLSALDPALASRIFATGGDVAKISLQDMNRAAVLMGQGGWDISALKAQGYYGASDLSDFLSNLDAKAKAMKAESQANMPPVKTYTDPAAIKQTARDLWRALFRMDPSEATTNQIAAEIHGMEAAAPTADQSTGTNGQSVDINARIQQILEGTGLYKQLYGNKPSGLSESDYQNQFVGQQGQMLGTQIDNGSIIEGMKTGDINTTTGQSAVTGLATNNSTFLGRLAQAAQVLGSMT